MYENGAIVTLQQWSSLFSKVILIILNIFTLNTELLLSLFHALCLEEIIFFVYFHLKELDMFLALVCAVGDMFLHV